MSRLRHRWRAMRRRLGLAIYGRLGGEALVPGWPPEEVEVQDSRTRTVGRQPRLSPEERAYWEAKGLHIYEEV